MGLLSALAIALLLVVLTLASYVDRLYSEMGKFLSGEFQENIDVWEAQVEQHLGMSRDRVALSAAILVRLSLAWNGYATFLSHSKRLPLDCGRSSGRRACSV